MEYIRQWKVGDQVFGSKAEAQRHEAREQLGKFLSADELIASADTVVDLLKPFCTPKTRKPKSTNGAVAAKAGKSKSADQPSA